jgi:glycosyltransferase involved in cell wall biosynthesis
MYTRRLYYRLKPVLPWSVRIVLRRWRARRILRACRDVWPIKPGSERKPEGWPGWPEGKQFAVVLTHDVEGQKGLDRCPQLMEMERNLGFRSSFNLIPEGNYQVSKELREDLGGQGFEVGIHDLYHDGKLYDSYKSFQAHAKRINSYLKDWNAVGFRSGFMHHNLEWLHHLNVLYDGSTFDTDPFEPQPDGVSTIFPFWVPRGRGMGYVELPYTLPQDFTLFVLQRHKTIEVWKKKLDWIARHGGMALVNVHPDYLSFEASTKRPDEFDAGFYEEFLQYVQTQFRGRFYHALARDVAGLFRQVSYRKSDTDFVEKNKTELSLRHGAKKNALMMAYTSYESDPRVIREAEAAVMAGFHVDFLALRREGQPRRETINGVEVIRLNQHKYRGSGYVRYILEYVKFFVRCFFKSATLGWRKRYDIAHVNNMPDFLVFSTILLKLRGAKVMLDIHDPMPNTFASKFKGKEKGFFYKLLLAQERWSARYSDAVLTVHEPVKDAVLVKHGLSPSSIHVISNFPDDQLFKVLDYPPSDGKLRMVFHGTILERYGLRNVMLALSQVRHRDQISFRIIGDGDFREKLSELVESLDLGDMVQLDRKVFPLREIPKIIAGYNLGMVPLDISSITNYILPLKLLEYIAMGLPVVTVKSFAIGYYLTESDCMFYQHDDVSSLSRLLDSLVEDPGILQRYRKRTLTLREKFLWSREKEKYIGLLRELTKKS